MRSSGSWRRALFGCVALTCCFSQAQAAIVTSIRPLGFIAAAIAEGVTPVDVLLPDGASPHDYALRPSDIQKIRQADLLLWIGPGMETFLTKLAAAQPADHTLSVAALPAVTPLIAEEHHHAHDHDHAEQGPGAPHTAQVPDAPHANYHLWLSPQAAQLTAQALYEKLLKLYPAKHDKLTANLQDFTAGLTKTDKIIAEKLASVRNKKYIVFHDAYYYFEQQFGLKPSGYFTLNPEIQPGARRLTQIRTQLSRQNIQCVFAEPQFRPAVINSVTQGVNIYSGTLDPIGGGITVDKTSYLRFLQQLASQYLECLGKEK